MVDRIAGEIQSIDDLPADQRERLKEAHRFVDPDAFLVSPLDTPDVKRDKKRRREIATQKMVADGFLPPSALDRLDNWPE